MRARFIISSTTALLLAAVAAAPNGAQAAEPSVTQPDVAAPSATEPNAATPSVTETSAAEPATSAPAATETSTAAPSTAEPNATTPSVATPSAAKTPTSETTPARPWEPPHHGRRWSLVATASYAVALADIWGLELEPFQFGVGARAAYTLPVGVWFGLHAEIFQGSTVQQTYEPALSLIAQDLSAESRAALVSVDVGYDQQLGPVALRYLVGLGVTILAWDFGPIPYDSLAGFSPMNGSLAGLHFDTGAGVVLPLGALELGAEGFFRVETSSQIPGSGGGRLVIGGRL